MKFNIIVLISILILSSILSQIYASIPRKFISLIEKAPHTIEINTVPLLQDALTNQGNVYFFTVGESMKAQCPYCHLFKKEFELISIQYWNTQGKKIIQNTKKTEAPLVVGFYSIEYRPDMMEIFQRFGLRQVPALLYIKDNSVSACDVMKNRMQDCINSWLSTKIEVPNQLEFLQQARNQQTTMESANRTVLNVKIALITIFSMIFILSVIAGLKVGFLNMFLTILSWAVFVLSIGGTVYILINHPPAFYLTQSGPMFFYNSQMQQLGLEGYIFSGTLLLCGCSFLSLTQVVPRFESSYVRRLLSSIFISIWIATLILSVGFFVYKNTWYMSGTPIYGYLSFLRKIFKN